MTQATLASGKRVTLTMEEKAKLLCVVDIHEDGVLAVISNSDPRIGYAVYHRNFKVTGCACTGCKQHGRTACAYRLAAQNKLNEMKRSYYCDLFDIYQVA